MSNPFARFREKIGIPGYAGSLKEAYRLDGQGKKSSMRVHAGLGDDVASCDYLLLNKDGFVLIEDTHLVQTIHNLQHKYGALSMDTRNELVTGLIWDENRRKVYGSMLVLCRLLKKWPQPCVFWLVVCGDAKVAQNLTAKWESRFHRGLVRPNLVKAVKIITVAQLSKELSKPHYSAPK